MATPPCQHAIDPTGGFTRTLFQTQKRYITKIQPLLPLSVHVNISLNYSWTNYLHFAHNYLDLHKVDRLHQSGRSCECACIQGSAGCGNNLSTTTVNGICMQGHIMDVEANSSHVLFTEDTLER